eukprot:scaffold2375_cov361-Pinguiococcus_pyrenoidosus.AAC.2
MSLGQRLGPSDQISNGQQRCTPVADPQQTEDDPLACLGKRLELLRRGCGHVLNDGLSLETHVAGSELQLGQLMRILWKIDLISVDALGSDVIAHRVHSEPPADEAALHVSPELEDRVQGPLPVPRRVDEDVRDGLCSAVQLRLAQSIF